MPLDNLWHLFNLRRSPFFQETAGSPDDEAFPVTLFVGRQAEARRALRVIGSSSSSRQVIQGPPGVGKTTLAQYVKTQAREAGFLSHPDPVSLGSADGTDHLLAKLLSYVYESLLSAEQASEIAEREEMQVTRQVIRAFRFREVSGQLSILGVGGGGGVHTQFVPAPSVATMLVVPQLLRQLMTLATTTLGAAGMVVHLNNLENLTDETYAAAGIVLRDIRDLLLYEGYHYVLVGTVDAVRGVIQAHAQVRSVFHAAAPLAPLSLRQFHQLLERRYAHLRTATAHPVRPPVTREAVAEVYTLFQGDLRGALRALDQAAHALVGYGSKAIDPMTAANVRVVLHGVYRQEMEATLTPALADALRKLTGVDDTEFTQRDAATRWSARQSMVSQTLAQLIHFGYVTRANRRGRQIYYQLTGAGRLVA